MNTKTKSQVAQAAAAIKAELKTLGVKASCKSEQFSMGNSVTVTVTDQPPAMLKQIEELCRKYKAGHFNGMEDIYEYSNSRDDIPQAKYVSVNHVMTKDYRQTLIDKVNARYGLSVTYEQYEKIPFAIEFHSDFGALDFGNEVYQLSTGAIDYEAHDRHEQREWDVRTELTEILDAGWYGKEGVHVIFTEDNHWSVRSSYAEHGHLQDDFSLAARDIAKLIAIDYLRALKQSRITKAAEDARQRRHAQTIQPVSVEYTEQPEFCYFPACNKNQDLTDNDQEILEKSDLVNCLIKKIVTLTPDDYLIVSESLLNNRPELWERIGGAQIEDRYLEGLQEGSKEYYQAWQDHGQILAVLVINAETQDRFVVNSEGYDYARYVGRTAFWYEAVANAPKSDTMSIAQNIH
jgi:Large polyvalent protein associated domain 29